MQHDEALLKLRPRLVNTAGGAFPRPQAFPLAGQRLGASPASACRPNAARCRPLRCSMRREEVEANMWTSDPGNKEGLAASYLFDPDNVHKGAVGKASVGPGNVM